MKYIHVPSKFANLNNEAKIIHLRISGHYKKQICDGKERKDF